MVRGSCLCGGVAWEASGGFEFMSHCHCSMCRKSHGTAFGTYLATQAEGFRWLRGEDQIGESQASAGRRFCTHCGSMLPDAEHDGLVLMPAGCLDDDPGLRPTAHIFVGSKAPWYEITDSLPQFDAFPPGAGTETKREDVAPATRPGVLRGSCLCGAVAFELDEPPMVLVYCHCTRCQKGRSAAHVTNAFVAREHFRWVRGEERVRRYKVPEADRFATYFCDTCGSCMPRPGRDQHATYAIPAGVLDDDPGIRAAFHIYCAYKAPWFEITDELPRHDEGVPGGLPARRET